MCEHVSRRHDFQSVSSRFCFMHTKSMCCPASGIPPGLSSLLHFSSSLPPRRSSVHLILFPPPPLRDETICHSLPSHCQMMDNSVTVLICFFFFLNCDQEDYPVVTSTPVFSRQKMATTEVTAREVGARLMMLPEDVLEVCIDVNRSHSRTLLPSSLLLSRCLYRAPF